MKKTASGKRFKGLWIFFGCFIGISLLLCYFLFIHKYSHKRSYNEDWMIGKTSLEIEEQYGRFFYPYTSKKDSDGYIRDGKGSYCMKTPTTDAFGQVLEYEQYLFIQFDSNGIAYKTASGKGGFWYLAPYDMEAGWSIYKEKDILGKTKEEIQEKYGSFDQEREGYSTYEIFRDPRFFGGIDEKHLLIHFENGVATDCIICRGYGGF